MNARRPLLQRVGAAATLVAVFVTGCTTGAGREPDPASTQWGPALGYEEALARIPLTGTAESPLAWEESTVADVDTDSAVRVARLFRALDHFTTSRDTDEDAYLYQWIATDQVIDVRFPDGPPGPEGDGFPPSRGPVWIWIVGAEREAPHRVAVHTCEDRGWRGTADGSDEPPNVNRAFLWHFEVVEQESADGETRWLVDRVWADRDLLGPEVRRECEEWAVHEPEENR